MSLGMCDTGLVFVHPWEYSDAQQGLFQPRILFWAKQPWKEYKHLTHYLGFASPMSLLTLSVPLWLVRSHGGESLF